MALTFQPSYVHAPHSMTSPQEGKTSILCCPYIHWSVVRFSVASRLRKDDYLSLPASVPELNSPTEESPAVAGDSSPATMPSCTTNTTLTSKTQTNTNIILSYKTHFFYLLVSS